MDHFVLYLLLNLPVPLHLPDSSGLREWPVRWEIRSEPGAFGNPRNPIAYREFHWNLSPSSRIGAEFINHEFSGDTLADGTVKVRESCEKHQVQFVNDCPEAETEVDSSLYGGLEAGPPIVWTSGFVCLREKLLSRSERRLGATSNESSMSFHWQASRYPDIFEDLVLDSIVTGYLITRERRKIQYDSSGRIALIRFDRISTGSPKDPFAFFSSEEVFTYFGSDSAQSVRMDSSSNRKRLGQMRTLRFVQGRLKSETRISGYDLSVGLDRRFETVFIYSDEATSSLRRAPGSVGSPSPDPGMRPDRFGRPYWDWVLGRRHAK